MSFSSQLQLRALLEDADTVRGCVEYRIGPQATIRTEEGIYIINPLEKIQFSPPNKILILSALTLYQLSI